MTTIGKRYLARHKKLGERMLDHRTRILLNAVLQEEPGRALGSWLRAMGRNTPVILGLFFMIHGSL